MAKIRKNPDIYKKFCAWVLKSVNGKVVLNYGSITETAEINGNFSVILPSFLPVSVINKKGSCEE